ncbi:MAG: hypothetical protein JNL61_05455 [Rhizobiaceae bacterium]|nr:hypothetical protein [Rhizobiaceae bacterium]
MRAREPLSGRPEVAFLRHMLLVLLAAFALAELPFGAHEGAASPGRLPSAFAEERRISEPAEQHSAADIRFENALDNVDGPSLAGFVDDAEPVPVPAAAWQLPADAGPAANGLRGQMRGAFLAPRKAVRSRAPPSLA